MTQSMSFETRLNALKNRVNKLENGNIPLEQALDQFHKGVKDVNILQTTLSTAQKAITKEVGPDGKEHPYSRDTGKTNTIPSSSSSSSSESSSTTNTTQSNTTKTVSSNNPFKN